MSRFRLSAIGICPGGHHSQLGPYFASPRRYHGSAEGWQTWRRWENQSHTRLGSYLAFPFCTRKASCCSRPVCPSMPGSGVAVPLARTWHLGHVSLANACASQARRHACWFFVQSSLNTSVLRCQCAHRLARGRRPRLRCLPESEHGQPAAGSVAQNAPKTPTQGLATSC